MTVARIWRERGRRYRLEAAKCKGCGKVFFPGRLVCDECGSREFEEIRLSDRGKIFTYTVIRVPPPAHTYETPYAVAIVELDAGAPRVHYVRHPFHREPDFGVTSVNYKMDELIERGGRPD